MATVGFQIGVLVALRVEIGAQVGVVLVEEVSLTDAYPEQVGVLGEQLVDLTIAVLIDVGEAVGIGLLLVDSGREQTYIAEHIRIVDADEEAVEATHRQSGNGTVRLVLLHTVGLLDEFHHIGEGGLEGTLHGLRQHHRGHAKTLGGLTRASLLRDVAVGHHQNHRLGLALGDEVVHDLCGTTQLAPCILVATDAVQQIEYGIFLTAGLVACRGVDGQSTGNIGRRTLVPYLCHRTVSHLVHLIQVCAGVTANEQHAEQVVDVADVIDVQRVDNLHAVDNHIIRIEFGLQGFCGETPHTLLVLHEVDNTWGVVGVSHILHLLRGQHVASKLHLLGLGGYQVESHRVVGMNIGGSHLRALSPAQVLLGLCCHTHQAEDSQNHHFLHCYSYSLVIRCCKDGASREQ